MFAVVTHAHTHTHKHTHTHRYVHTHTRTHIHTYHRRESIGWMAAFWFSIAGECEGMIGKESVRV